MDAISLVTAAAVAVIALVALDLAHTLARPEQRRARRR
jgi:hypothetical protein